MCIYIYTYIHIYIYIYIYTVMDCRVYLKTKIKNNKKIIKILIVNET